MKLPLSLICIIFSTSLTSGRPLDPQQPLDSRTRFTLPDATTSSEHRLRHTQYQSTSNDSFPPKKDTNENKNNDPPKFVMVISDVPRTFLGGLWIRRNRWAEVPEDLRLEYK